MAVRPPLLSADDLRRLATLQVLARSVVEGFCSGLHRSPHKGFSVEFREHRAYVPGDEIRRLDWKLYGRRDRFYVREFEDETNVRATLVLDASGSMAYGDPSKLEYAARLAAGLAWLLLQQSDAVGLLTFDTAPRRYIPPRARPGHLRVLTDALERTVAGGETDLGGVLHDVAARVHRRGLLIVISDCLGPLPQLLAALAHLRFVHHDVSVIQVLHPDEIEFPFRGWTRFESLERAGHARLLDPAVLREAYRRRVDEFQRDLRRGCHRHRVDWTLMTTDRPWAESLARHLARRRRRA
ncbi:MAG: DUF58 domain-containing protein [Kiritimatiellae bacterium]|nr:DUF58 domain-containing protein [Kiritimatiellia bacterium]